MPHSALHESCSAAPDALWLLGSLRSVRGLHMLVLSQMNTTVVSLGRPPRSCDKVDGLVKPL